MDRIIAVNSNCYHGFSIDEAIDGIAAAGFRYIELTATKGWTEHVFPTHQFSELIRIKNRLIEENITPIAMSGHTNLMDKDRIQDFILNIELAAFYKCNYIVSSIGEAHLDDKAFATNQEVAEHIKKLVPILEDHKLKLVLESHGDHGTGAILKEIVNLIDSESVAIAYDTANVRYHGNVEIEKDLPQSIDKVQYIHLKDKKGPGKVWNFPALGKGDINLPLVFEMLRHNNNNSPMSIEIEFTEKGPENLEEVNQAVKTSYDYLKLHGFHI